MDSLSPGRVTPNELELAILRRLSEQRPSMRDALPRLHVLSHEFTGVGSYTNVRVDDEAAESTETLSLDADIRIPSLSNGLGGVLFLAGGEPKCLELFAYGELWDGRHEGFTIE